MREKRRQCLCKIWCVCVCVCAGGGGRLRDKQGVYVCDAIVANGSFIGFVPSRALAL